MHFILLLSTDHAVTLRGTRVSPSYQRNFRLGLTFSFGQSHDRLTWEHGVGLSFFFCVHQSRLSALIAAKWVNRGLEIRFLGCTVSLNYRDTGLSFTLQGNGLISLGELGK